jgi:hypothetical protein
VASAVAASLATLLAIPAQIQAQLDTGVGILPHTRYFASPLADPIEPRFSLGLLLTNVLATPGRERQSFAVPDAVDARSDLQASAALGGTFPLWSPLVRPEGGIIVGAQAGVFARFRMEVASRDDLTQDWLVALPIEAAWNDFSGRVRISHRSSHLGDEFIQATEAERIEFGGESLDVLAAYQIGNAGRVYAGGGWVFRSYTDRLPVLRLEGKRDRYVVQLGADGKWNPAGERVELIAGADWQAAERTGWRGALALAGGVALRQNGRWLGMVARYFEGTSSMGQFFITPEEFWSLELILGFF